MISELVGGPKENTWYRIPSKWAQQCVHRATCFQNLFKV